MKRNGFAMTGLLILMPALIAIFAVMAAAFLVVRSDAQARQVCRMELLKSQEKVAKNLNELIGMNKYAKTLRKMRDTAEESVKLSAPFPPLHAIAQATRAGVIAAQTAFAIRQKYLYLGAKIESRSGPYLAGQTLSRAISQDQTSYNGSGGSVINHSTSGGSFAVSTSPSETLTPDYNPDSDFTDKQNSSIKWRLALDPLLPFWLKSLAPVQNLNIKASCSATLVKKGDKWKSILNADKFYSR